MKTSYKIEKDGTGHYGVFTRLGVGVAFGLPRSFARIERVNREAFHLALGLASRASMPADDIRFRLALLGGIRALHMPRTLPDAPKLAKAALDGYSVSAFLSALGR